MAVWARRAWAFSDKSVLLACTRGGKNPNQHTQMHTCLRNRLDTEANRDEFPIACVCRWFHHRRSSRRNENSSIGNSCSPRFKYHVCSTATIFSQSQPFPPESTSSRKLFSVHTMNFIEIALDFIHNGNCNWKTTYLLSPSTRWSQSLPANRTSNLKRSRTSTTERTVLPNECNNFLQ